MTAGKGGPHDIGGVSIKDLDNEGLVNWADKPMLHWEVQVHALLVCLACHKPDALITTDELRRGVEGLEKSIYDTWSYYDKWATVIASMMLERHVITEDELNGEIAGDEKPTEMDHVKYQPGELVRVRSEQTRLRWRRPHLRCPGYIFGQVGRVVKHLGEFADPFLLAFRGNGPKQHLYAVMFPMKSVFPTSESNDEIELEVYQEWLEPASIEHEHSHSHDSKEGGCCDHEHERDAGHDHVHKNCDHDAGHEHAHEHCDHNAGHEHAHEHCDHDAGHEHAHKHCDQDAGHEHAHEHHNEAAAASHDHDHSHLPRVQVEQIAADKEGEISVGQVICKALLSILARKGIVAAATLTAAVQRLETTHANLLGADLVVRAWKDPEFKKRLVADGPTAALELGIQTSNPNAPTVLRVMPCTPEEHHVIVCTLCSCYPLPLLGFSPSWYKSRNYRARMVVEPRKVLAEFGLEIPSNRRVVVHDSTADCRYMILPLPPSYLTAEQIQEMSDEELRKLVTRDSMVGVAMLG